MAWTCVVEAVTNLAVGKRPKEQEDGGAQVLPASPGPSRAWALVGHVLLVGLPQKVMEGLLFLASSGWLISPGIAYCGINETASGALHPIISNLDELVFHDTTFKNFEASLFPTLELY